VTADSLPILSGMSIKRIVINPGAMRTPHWHADCNELTYCVLHSVSSGQRSRDARANNAAPIGGRVHRYVLVGVRRLRRDDSLEEAAT
jgi:hypothetical protein